MGIPEEIDYKLNLQQAINIAQMELLPDVERIFKRAKKSTLLLRVSAKTKNKDFPVVIRKLYMGKQGRKWVALLTAVTREDFMYSFYTPVVIDNHSFVLKYITNKVQARWEIILPSFFEEYRDFFYLKYIAQQAPTFKLIYKFSLSNPHKIETFIDIDKDLGGSLAFGGLELTELNKDDQLSISIIQDGVALGYVRDGLRHYNHFIPCWMLAEKEELQRFHEVFKMLTKESSVLTIKEKNSHYLDKFKELCTLECYVELLTCDMSNYYK